MAASASPNPSNIILFALLGIGGYWFVTKRARAGQTMPVPSNRQGGIMPSAGYATADRLFGAALGAGLLWAKGGDPRTVSPGYGKYAAEGPKNYPSWESDSSEAFPDRTASSPVAWNEWGSDDYSRG